VLSLAAATLLPAAGDHSRPSIASVTSSSLTLRANACAQLANAAAQAAQHSDAEATQQAQHVRVNLSCTAAAISSSIHPNSPTC
jgi:hypothetical protein